MVCWRCPCVCSCMCWLDDTKKWEKNLYFGKHFRENPHTKYFFFGGKFSRICCAWSTKNFLNKFFWWKTQIPTWKTQLFHGLGKMIFLLWMFGTYLFMEDKMSLVVFNRWIMVLIIGFLLDLSLEKVSASEITMK